MKASMDDDKGLNVLDVKRALEEVFKGCKVEMSHIVGSQHAKVAFDEYEVRIILSGSRKPDRKKHLRFLRKVKSAGGNTIKTVLIDLHTTDEKALAQGIKDVRAHLMGVVQAIQHALKPKHKREMDGVDALLNSPD